MFNNLRELGHTLRKKKNKNNESMLNKNKKCIHYKQRQRKQQTDLESLGQKEMTKLKKKILKFMGVTF